MKVYVNIDKPLKRITVHRNQKCTYVSRYLQETDFKGVGNLKRDGGWLILRDQTEFQNNKEVKGAQRDGYDIIHCSKC